MALAAQPLREFLEDPSQWGADFLVLRRSREDKDEIGYLFSGSPHVYLQPSQEGYRYAYPGFEALLQDGWRLDR